MMKIFKPMFVAALFAVSSLSGTAVKADTILDTDDFDYPDGASLIDNGWINHSGTAGDLVVNGGRAIVQHGAPSEDAHLLFATQSSGILRAEFDIIVDDDTAISGGDFEYFAHFYTEGSFNFRSRLDVVEASSGGDYTLGISSETGTAEATLSTDLTFGDTVAVILDFDLDTGTGSLTVGGETIVGSAAGAQTLDSFALRQSDSSNNETVSVDNLVIRNISAIPEPASAVLFGLAGLGLCVVRRRG